MKTKAKLWIAELPIANILFILTVCSLSYVLGQQHHQNSEMAGEIYDLKSEVSALKDNVIELSAKISYMGKQQDYYEEKRLGVR